MYKITDIKNTIINGNTLDVLHDIPSESIDCVITSPPYWGLRSYSTNGQVWLSPNGSLECNHSFNTEVTKWHSDRGNGKRKEVFDDTFQHEGTKHGFCECGAWRGELGLEPTFQLYIEHLQTVFDEVYRVLKKTGTCWVNIGDSYSGSNGITHPDGGRAGFGKPCVGKKCSNFAYQVPYKSLCNIPHRFAISMTDHNWIERNHIIWQKPSCMPSSAKDRFTVDFESVFFFTKAKRYYFEQQFEPLNEGSKRRAMRGVNDNKYSKDEYFPEGVHANTMSQPRPYRGYDNMDDAISRGETALNPNGRNKRTVWRINTAPFKGAHFAVFPPALITPMVEAGSPPEICSVCNKPHIPMYEVTKVPQTENYTGQAVKDYESAGAQNPSDVKRRVLESATNLKTKVGYEVQCDCNGDTHAGIVLDPFMGSGTTAIVAKKLGRDYLGIDLQPDYVKMANKRLAEML